MQNQSHSDNRATATRISLTLPTELQQSLRGFAEETDRSVAAVVRLALRQLLNTQSAPTPRREVT
jgi:hypothetical protein